MEFYASGKKKIYQPKSNYQPNIDAGLLAHVREEVFKREEEQRKQREIEEAKQAQDEKRSKLASQIQSIVTNLPMYVKENIVLIYCFNALKNRIKIKIKYIANARNVPSIESTHEHVDIEVLYLNSIYQEKMTSEVINSLALSLMDGTVFEIVRGLEDIQQLTERNLLNKRMKLINSQKGKLIINQLIY